MYQKSVVVCCFLTTVYAGWLDELKDNGQGLKLGNGLSLYLDRLDRENVSIFSKHALRLNYGKFGLSVGKALNADALELGLYVKDTTEGRGKKVDEITIPAIIGFKVTSMAALFFTIVAVVVFKSLAITNLSAAVAAGVMLAKFLNNYKPQRKHIELEQSAHPYLPSFYGYPSAMGYSINGFENYKSYPEYDTSHIYRSENQGQYSVVETPEEEGSNSTTVEKRVDNKRKQHFFNSFPLKEIKIL